MNEYDPRREQLVGPLFTYARSIGADRLYDRGLLETRDLEKFSKGAREAFLLLRDGKKRTRPEIEAALGCQNAMQRARELRKWRDPSGRPFLLNVERVEGVFVYWLTTEGEK